MSRGAKMYFWKYSSSDKPLAFSTRTPAQSTLVFKGISVPAFGAKRGETTYSVVDVGSGFKEQGLGVEIFNTSRKLINTDRVSELPNLGIKKRVSKTSYVYSISLTPLSNT
jgi:hypothetical protein